MSSDEYVIDETKIVFASGACATFAYPVAEALAFDSALVVRLEVPTGIVFNENVYGLSPSGETLWQVAARAHVNADSPYVNLARDGNRVVLTNWDGLELTLDPSNGHILRQRHVR
ncbi:MAG TPA: hypothetical protein VF666_03915 [Pyrinomonadaceae bacterium]